MNRSRKAMLGVFGLLFVIGRFMFAQTPVSIFNNFSGKVNYTVIGGSLRTSGNTVNPVALRATDTSKLNYPSGAAVIGAYLYWAGSDTVTNADNSVSLDGNTINASRTFTDKFLNGSAWINFFGGFADVTSYVQSQANNKTYTFGDLTVNTTGNYLTSQATVAGWAMVVVYSDTSEVKKSVNIFDGFQIFRGSQITFTPNNFYVPYALVEGKMTHVTYEGDKENSAFLVYNEEVKFGGGLRTPTSLTDAYNPVNNQFASRSNAFPEDSTFGLDIDTYDITSYLQPADTIAQSIYSSGGDLVILNVEIISIADTANSDIQVTKTHSGGSIVAGNNVTYSLLVQNNGPDSTGTITLYDSLRTGLTFVSSSYSGWTIDSSARPKYKWTHTDAHPPGWSSTVNVTAYLTAVNYPTQLNSASASSPQFDRKPWNNASTDSLTILSPIFLTSIKSYTDLNGGSVRPGDTLLYKISVKNSGNWSGSNISVLDSMPTGMSVVPSSFSPSATYSGTSATGQVVTFGNFAGPLVVGDSTSFQFRVVIDSTILGGSTVTNVARVRSATIDQRITSSFVPVNAPKLIIQKFRYSSGTGNGDTIYYYMVVKNAGTFATSPNTQVIDTIPNPSGTPANDPYFITGSATPSGVVTTSGADTILTWSLGSRAPGSVDTVKFKMRISDGLTNGTTITNKGWASNSQGSKDSSYLSYTKQPPVVTISKYIYPPGSGTGAGDTVQYYIVVTNTSTSGYSTNTQIVDSLPEPTATIANNPFYFTGAAPGWVITRGVNVGDRDTIFTWTIPNMAPGEIDTLKLKMRIPSTLPQGTVVRNQALVSNTQGLKDSSTFLFTKSIYYSAKIYGTRYILPGDSIFYEFYEADTNKNVSTIESLKILDSNRVNGDYDSVLVTESAANTGLFLGKMRTVYGTVSNGNNTGGIAVKPGDSIRIRYIDKYDSTSTSLANAQIKNIWRTFVTYVLNGHAVALSGTSVILPSDTIYYTVNDSDLNRRSTVIETYTFRDSNQVTGEIENLLFTETGANTGIFTSKVLTVFGTSSYAPVGTMAVQRGDTVTLKYYDSVIVNGSNGGLKTWKTYVTGGANASIIATSPIHPLDSILITITDKDLNKNISVIETYTVKDSSISTGEVEIFTITERSVNDSVFTKKLATQFGLTAGTNNDGSFNVKAGDSLRVSYKDTLLYNGGPGSTIIAGTVVLGGVTATLGATSPIYPGDSLTITITDADLNKNASVAETYTVQDSSIATTEVEIFTVTETGINTGIFAKKLGTQFGLVSDGSVNGRFNVKAGDSLRVTYRDSLRLNGSDTTLVAYTRVLGGVTATLAATSPIYPGDSLTITITDADLNKNASVAETYTVKDSSISNGGVETFTVTETGVNTGIFTKKLGTQFGLLNDNLNDGRFNVKAGDSLRVTYTDTLQTNGSTAILIAFTQVVGGATAVLSASPMIIAANDSSTFTLTDADLNKNAATIQSYTFTVVSSTGESELMTFTETGVNTGIFTKKVPTIVGITPGGNNTGVFTVQPNDTIRVSYLDSLTAIGDTATISTFFRIGSVNFTTSSKTYQDLNGGFVKPPDTLQYTVKVKNSGTVTATNIALKDTLPTDVTILGGTISGGGSASGRVISWPVFNLIVGDSATYQYNIRVDSTIVSQVPSINKATIDGNGIRYQVTASFTPVNRPLMTMTKVANRTTAKPGDTIMYTINYSNIGTVPAAFVTLTDAQPDNTTYVPNSVTINGVPKTDDPDLDAVTLSGITIQLNIGVINPGISGTVTMKVRVN